MNEGGEDDGGEDEGGEDEGGKGEGYVEDHNKYPRIMVGIAPLSSTSREIYPYLHFHSPQCYFSSSI